MPVCLIPKGRFPVFILLPASSVKHSSKLESALKLAGDNRGELVSADEMSGYNPNAVIIFELGEGDFHAVNSMLFDSEHKTFSYFDHQNPDQNGNPSSGAASYENIKYIYLKH